MNSENNSDSMISSEKIRRKSHAVRGSDLDDGVKRRHRKSAILVGSSNNLAQDNMRDSSSSTEKNRSTSRSRDRSPQVNVDRSNGEATAAVPRIQVSGPELPKPTGSLKVTIDRRLNIPVDKLFEMLYTDSQFYRQWMSSRKEKPYDLNVGAWQGGDSQQEEVTREVIYFIHKNIGITTANIKVTQKYKQCDFCQPGQVYGIDMETVNTGLAYADSFILKEHHRLTSESPELTHFYAVAELDFIKSPSLFKSKIETETWDGLKKANVVLEGLLDGQEQKSQGKRPDKFGSEPDGAKRKKKSLAKTETAPSPFSGEETPTFNYSEAWRMVHSILLSCILGFLVLAVFQISWTLDLMDERLANIEKAFLPKL